jgi:hypothetical protein
MAVFLYPVRTDPPGDSSQDMAGQVRHPDPGQDQKPHVVGQEIADKVISGGTLPGRRAKEKAVHVFNMAIGSMPIPQKAQLFGKPGAILQEGVQRNIRNLLAFFQKI